MDDVTDDEIRRAAMAEQAGAGADTEDDHEMVERIRGKLLLAIERCVDQMPDALATEIQSGASKIKIADLAAAYKYATAGLDNGLGGTVYPAWMQDDDETDD